MCESIMNKDNKKIGIVTIFFNINYGSKLQAFALQKALGRLGYEAENIIVHANKNCKKNKVIKVFRHPSILVKMLLFRSKYHKRESIFQEYMEKYIKVSKYTEKELVELQIRGRDPYYKYICGSDQIWAPNQFSDHYFLAFVKENNKKIAYAPSIGLPKIPDTLIPKYQELINSIGFLSIREKDGANLVKEITNRTANVVLDPTLLLTKNEWNEHATKSKLEEPYILCYFLGNNQEHRKWVKNYSNRVGYKLVVLPFVIRDFLWGDKQVFNAGPKEFIGLIEGAKVICTDSYHGILFSLNLNKDFYAFLRFKENENLNQNSRILNLLEKLDLKQRIVDLNLHNKFKPINWQIVNSVIENERAQSIEFLRNSLHE